MAKRNPLGDPTSLLLALAGAAAVGGAVYYVAKPAPLVVAVTPGNTQQGIINAINGGYATSDTCAAITSANINPTLLATQLTATGKAWLSANCITLDSGQTVIKAGLNGPAGVGAPRFARFAAARARAARATGLDV